MIISGGAFKLALIGLSLFTIIIPGNTEIIDHDVRILSDAISGFEKIEFKNPEIQYVEDTAFLQRKLKLQGEQIKKYLEDCTINQIIFEKCGRAMEVYKKAQGNLLEHETAIYRLSTEIERRINRDWYKLTYLGIENETDEFREIYIAIKRFRNKETSNKCENNLESKIMCVNHYLKKINENNSIYAYVSFSNNLLGSDSLYIIEKEQHEKINSMIHKYEEIYKNESTKFDLKFQQLKEVSKEISDEDFSVINSGKLKIKESKGIYSQNTLEFEIAKIQLNRNKIEQKNKRKERGFLKDGLDFYKNTNPKIEENIEFYKERLEKLKEEHKTLNAEYNQIKSKYKNKLMKPSGKSISEKIISLREILNNYRILVQEDISFEKEKRNIQIELIEMKEKEISTSAEKDLLKTADSPEDLVNIRKLIFDKNKEHNNELNSLKRKFEEKKFMLGHAGIVISSDTNNLNDLKKEIKKADETIEKNKHLFVDVNEKVNLLEKPVCNKKINYEKVKVFRNNIKMPVTNYEYKGRIVSLGPSEKKVLVTNHTTQINCKIEKQVLNSDQNWKYMIYEVNVETLFNETLLEIKNYRLEQGDGIGYKNYILLDSKKNQFMIKQKVNIEKKITEYSINKSKIKHISVLNLDSDLNNFRYEVNAKGNISCNECIKFGNTIIFEYGKFNLGDKLFLNYTIEGEEITTNETINTKKFNKTYEQSEEKEEMANYCFLLDKSENCTETILDEIRNKHKIREIKEKIKKLNETGIDPEHYLKKAQALEEIELQLNESAGVYTYFSGIKALNESITNEINNIEIKAREKLLIAKEKFETLEDKHSTYDYLEAAVSDFQDKKYERSINNSEKIINYAEAAKDPDLTWMYILGGIIIIGAGIYFFKDKKIEKPLKKKTLKIFEDEF